MSKNTTEETYSSHNREPDELTLEAPKHPWTAEMTAIKKEHEKPKFESPALRQMSRFDTAQGSYGKANEPRTITVAELFDEIKSDKHKAVCDFLRSPEYQSQAEELDARHKALIEKRSATQDSEERAKIDAERDQVKQALTELKAGKHQLPAVTFSATCKGGHGLKNAVSHTGIYQVDLDLKDNPALADSTSRAKIKRTLDIDSRVLGLFDSPSNGLKVLVLVNSQSLETRAHEHAWKLANEYVCNLVRNKCGFDLEYDDSCKNPTRLCFLSHDPAAQLDELATPLEYTEPTEPAREEPRKAHELQRAPRASGKSAAGLKPMEAYNQSNDFEELLRQLGATKTKCGGWLRDGGTSPRSASWNEKTLWVFSDSFGPLKQNTGYTPSDLFAVFVLGLESASDDTALVVRELSKLGFGDQGDALTGEDRAWIEEFTENIFNKKAAGAASTVATPEAKTEPDKALAVSIWDQVPAAPIATPYIDLDTEPEADDFKAFLKGVPLAEDCDLVVISARLKSFKSSIVAAMACSLVADDETDCLGFKLRGNGAVLIFDTEQSTKEIQNQSKAMRRRLGVASTPEQIKIVGLREYAPIDRMKIIKAAIEEQDEIAAVVVDGASDLCGNVNDPETSSTVVQFLMVAAVKANAPLFGVIHLNHSDREAMGGGRGHLGKEMERKAKSVVCVEKDSDGIGTIYAATTRRQPVSRDNGQRVQFCSEQNMVVSIEGTKADVKKAEKTDELIELADAVKIDTGTHVWKYSQLCKAIMSVEGVKDRTAKRRIKEMVQAEIVTHSELTGNYVLKSESNTSE